MRIILAGAAASGKDYFRDYLYQRGYKVDVSYTSRPKRDGEKEGYTYNFISRQGFERMKRKKMFYEEVEFAGNYYGTSQENWENCDVFIMTPSGIKHITDEDDKSCYIIYFDIPLEIRKERLSLRSDFDTVERRIKSDEEDFEGFDNYNLVVRDSNFNPEILAKEVKEDITNLTKLYSFWV